MASDIEKEWESDSIVCPSTTIPELIAILRGGESITLKSEASTDKYHYVGRVHILEAGRGYKLWGGETMTISFGKDFGRNNVIKIYALPNNANDPITFFKAYDSFPETEG